MSLLNQMLRDLADQQQGAKAPSVDQPLLAVETGYAREGKKAWLPSFVVFTAVLTALFAAHQGFRYFDSVSPREEATPYSQTSSSAVAVPPAEETAASGATAITTTEKMEREVIAMKHDLAVQGDVPKFEDIVDRNSPARATAEAEPSAMQQLALEAWLKLAKTALQQDRLTFPPGDNAYEYFGRVLAWNPEHPQAQQGLRDIVLRYLALIDEAAEQQQWSRARTLFDRAATIAAPRTPLMEQRFLAWEQRLNTQAFEPATPAQPLLASAPVEQSPGETVSVSVPELPPVRAADQQIVPNREWQDRQMADQARNLFHQGQVETARMQLENFLQLQGQANLSSQMLCHIYLESGDLAAAEQLLAEAEFHRWPLLDRVRLQAQWLVARGDHAAAIAQLEAHLTEAQDDERYRVLLASLYQTAGRHHEAVASYRRLLTTFGEKSSYWLGLALALDALGQRASALEAYRRVRELRPQQVEVNTYIEQRIAALSR